jgi:hypothetical protein
VSNTALTLSLRTLFDTIFGKAMPSSEKEQVHLKKPFSLLFSFDSRWFCPIDLIPSFRDQLLPSFRDQFVPSFRDLRILWCSSLFSWGSSHAYQHTNDKGAINWA